MVNGLENPIGRISTLSIPLWRSLLACSALFPLCPFLCFCIQRISLRRVINGLDGRYAEREYSIASYVGDRKITVRDDVHPKEYCSVGGQPAQGHGPVVKLDVVWESQVDKKSLGALRTRYAMYLHYSRWLEFARVDHGLRDDGVGGTRIPDRLELSVFGLPGRRGITWIERGTRLAFGNQNPE